MTNPYTPIFAILDQPKLPKPMDNMSNFREVHVDPISKDCLERVKQMIQLCDQRHPQCHPSVSTSLPLRVIDVGASCSDPRLHISQGEAADYIALSHCWGSDQNLTTERATLPERLRGIDWDTLPKTFRDAISITRMLGVKYIWIDSLCIIQDDRCVSSSLLASASYANAIIAKIGKCSR
jgi:Heterokaryon incompatibility protein (HET)